MSSPSLLQAKGWVVHVTPRARRRIKPINETGQVPYSTSDTVTFPSLLQGRDYVIVLALRIADEFSSFIWRELKNWP